MKTIVSPSTTKNTVSVSTTTKTVTVSGTGTVGPQGGTGATGATGPAGTIAVGSVTTGDAGSSVLITNTGSTTEATLNFTIPKGDTGKTILNGTGAPGSGVGVVGDFYVDTSADTIYGPKDSSGSPWGSGVSFAVANGSVTLAKMANLATDKIIGRTTAGTGVPEALSVHDILNMAGTPSDNYILKYDSASSQWVPEVDVDTDTVYTHPNHSGEVTSTGHGATVIEDNVVDEANLKVSNSPTNGYFLSAQSGNTGGLTWAVPTDTDTVYTHPNHSGDVVSASDGATTIQDDAVTYAKIQNVSATDRILGRDSAGSGVIEEITPANLRAMLNVADGAEANVNADWNSSSGDSQISNKPTLVSLSQVAALAVALG